MTEKYQWPRSVPVPRIVGRGQYFRGHDMAAVPRPCCGLGHAARALTKARTKAGCVYAIDKANTIQLFCRAYLLAANTYYASVTFDDPAASLQAKVAGFNDGEVNRRRRALFYNTAMATLGYTEGQPDDVLDLFKQAKKQPGYRKLQKDIEAC